LQALLSDTPATTTPHGKVEPGSLLNDLDHPVSSSPQVQSQSQSQPQAQAQVQVQEQEQVRGRPSLDVRLSSIDDRVPSLPSTPIYNHPTPSPFPSPTRARASVAQPMGTHTSTRFAMLFGRAGVPVGVEKGSGGLCGIFFMSTLVDRLEEVLMTRRLSVGPMTSAGEVPGQGRITFLPMLSRRLT
jgi:hypothetical protein